MIFSEPSHCALSESQKTALQVAMSAASQSHDRRSAIPYHHQTMEMGLRCGRQAGHVGDWSEIG